jgi:penicillin-binding protein 1A
MYELGKIDNLSYETASAAPITAGRRIANIGLDAPYISEMARQIMLERFGDEIYERGFNVYLTVNSEYQQKAEQALRKGLLEYDVRHGYRGPVGHLDLDSFSAEQRDAELVESLDGFPVSREIVPAVVLDIKDNAVAALNVNGENVNVEWENILWARKYINPNSIGPELGGVREILKIGDIVYLQQFDGATWVLSQLPEVSGALVSLDPHSGAIFALTGGFDYFLSKFNRATQAQRQPGSNIKPFIYSAALANGFTPSSMVSAAPIVIEDDLEGVWRPQNYSKKFFGPTRLRKALSLSLNLVSVRLLRAIGIENTIDHLERFGFDTDRLPKNLSLALGSTQVTPLELAASFAVMANGGRNIKPYLIENIIDADGFEVELPATPCVDCINQPETDQFADDDLTLADIANFEFDTQLVMEITAGVEEATDEYELPEQAISPQNAFLMQDMLKHVITSGTGRRALVLERNDLAGKTGTTNDFRDAWFSGFTPDVMTTVFVGFDEPSHLGRREAGGAAALPIWVDYMGRVLQDYPEQEETIPEDIVTRFVNKENGEVTYPEDPDGYSEYYLSGTEPTNLVEAASESTTSNQEQSVTETLF